MNLFLERATRERYTYRFGGLIYARLSACVQVSCFVLALFGLQKRETREEKEGRR